MPVGALGDPRDPLADRIEAVEAALFADHRVEPATDGPSCCGVDRVPGHRGPGRRAAVRRGRGARGAAGRAAAGRRPGAALAPGRAGPWLWWPVGGRVVACPDPAVLGALVTELLAPVVAAVRARAAVAERVLWGNVASSVASARQLVAAVRPDAAPRAADVGRHLLTTAPFAATATLRDPAPPDVGWTFQRRSCCLYYRVPGGGICGDCVLRRPVRRTRTAGDRSLPLA